MKAKTCSKCHLVFSCGRPEPGCWCEAVHLTQEVLQLLQEKYNDCLCPECLKSFEQVSSSTFNTALPG